ncbi:hypothetical protein PSHT_00632, partial [Puccinia striiformis]
MVGPSHAMPRQRVYFSPYLLLQTLGEGEFGKVKLGVHSSPDPRTALPDFFWIFFEENPQKLIEMINRHSRLTRSIGQIGPIQSTTSLRLNLHQAQRNLSATTTTAATTSTAATSAEDVNETKNQKTTSSSNSIGSEGEIERLEILSEVNDVQVRKNHNSGSDQVDMSKPMYRFLEQQRWRKDGQLGLGNRPSIESLSRSISIDRSDCRLRIKFDIPIHKSIISSDNPINTLHFGPLLFCNDLDSPVFSLIQSTKRPVMQAQVFYPEPRLYTIVMVDPDVPDPRNHSFTTFLHWVRTNVSMSATTNGQLDLTPTQPEAEELKYVGPHPQRDQQPPIHDHVIEQSGPIDLSVHSHHYSKEKDSHYVGSHYDLMATSCGSPCYAAPELVVQDGRYVGSQWLAKYQHLFTRSLKELERLSEENEQAKRLMLQRQRQLMAANTANQSQTVAGPNRTRVHGSSISVKEGGYLFQEGLDPYDSSVPALQPVQCATVSKRVKTVQRPYGGSRCGNCVRHRIVRAFLVEEAKIVKKVLKSQAVAIKSKK